MNIIFNFANGCGVIYLIIKGLSGLCITILQHFENRSRNKINGREERRRKGNGNSNYHLYLSQDWF